MDSTRACSRSIARSIACSAETTDDAIGSAGDGVFSDAHIDELIAAATSRVELSSRRDFIFVTPQLSKSVGQLEDDVEHCYGIDRLSFALRRFVLDALRGFDRVFVEAVTESAHDTQDAGRAVCSEIHFEQHFAFELEIARFS